MKKISIAEASDAQLRTFAVEVQQLEGVPQDRGGIIASLVEGGWTHDYILAAGEETPPAATASAEPSTVLQQLEETSEPAAEMPAKGFSFWTSTAKGKPPCPMITVKVQSTDRPGGNDPAHPVINNSPPLVIQRNRWVRIPWDFYKVLHGAGGTALLPDGNNKDFIRQDYKEYPMEVRPGSEPSVEAVRAWDAWAGSQELGHPKAQAA